MIYCIQFPRSSVPFGNMTKKKKIGKRKKDSISDKGESAGIILKIKERNMSYIFSTRALDLSFSR